MPYASIADFTTAFGHDEAIALTNLDNPQIEVIGTAMLTRALDDATALIDGYLSIAGYTLPITPAPPILLGYCCDIARYKLDRNQARDEVRMRYEDAISWLKDVAKGLASLGVDAGGEAVTPDTGGGLYSPGVRVFRRESLKYY